MSSLAVSVITVCKNAKQLLRRTEASVRAQKCSRFEWIIVDGNSEDGTREHLELIDGNWIRWISEPDEGIYHAMNKGIRMAKGEWLWFLNAGDVLCSETVVEMVAKLPQCVDICFGEVVVEGLHGESLGLRSEITPHKLPGNLEKSLFRYGMVVSHQAFLVRRHLAPEYDHKRYRLSGDLDWMLRILSEPKCSCRMGRLAHVSRFGATKENWYRSQMERFLVMCRHFGTVQTVFNHMFVIMRRLSFIFWMRKLR